MTKVLITGCAGFIGFHLSKRLLATATADGRRIVGLDNLNDYYDVNLKQSRLSLLTEDSSFRFVKLGLEDRLGMERLFAEEGFEIVVNLAGQAGVRYSVENPCAYVQSNLVGFGNVLEGCRQTHVKHLVFASSSSVYGGNIRMPFSVRDNVDHPLSLYAATKKANELMAHSYASLFGLPCTGLRFFTVYGPWGRPDMAIYIFAKAILEGRPIRMFNYGNMQRDFTYVDDIVEGVVRVMHMIPQPDPTWTSESGTPGRSFAPYRIYNIGNHHPEQLTRVVQLLEEYLKKKAIVELTPMEPGDVPATYADVDDLVRDTAFKPATPIEEGIRRFVEWYREYRHAAEHS